MDTEHRHPLPPLPSPLSRNGLSLLEVLVSVFIISMGLLGVAALIPLGKLAISQTNIADRTGACGRAALRHVQVRRMVDHNNWVPATPPAATLGAICIDPLGFASFGNVPLGGAPAVPRLSLGTGAPMNFAQADPIFRWGDELLYVLPKDMSPPQPGERPAPVVDTASGVHQNEGNFSWFFTISPSPSDFHQGVPVGIRRDFEVSVVVCHKRDFGENRELATANPVDFLGGGYGGGTIQINDADAGILNRIKTDQWVLLADGGGATAKWYRVVGVGGLGMNYLSLVGPDWNTTTYPQPILIVVPSVTGVYTRTIHLDNDCTWNR
ncbi:MAG: hypothetical protein GX594_16010 [Pirellulaceae bacterium]|nr:hypothetical protein [Pirellulaceae bacterium]